MLKLFKILFDSHSTYLLHCINRHGTTSPRVWTIWVDLVQLQATFGVLLNTSVTPQFFFLDWLKTPDRPSESGSRFSSFLLLLSYITFLEDIGTIVSLNASLHIEFQKHSFRSWWWIQEDNLYLSENNINLRKEVSRIILVFLSSNSIQNQTSFTCLSSLYMDGYTWFLVNLNKVNLVFCAKLN